jgi:hypothetical protein
LISVITLDDHSGIAITLHAATGKRGMVSATGLLGIAAPRTSQRVRPSAHGGISETRYEDGKLIVLNGEVMSNVGIEDVDTEFHAVCAPMLDTLDYGPALLKWTEGTSGLNLQRYVTLNSSVEPEQADNAAIINYQCQLFAEDPRAYSQTLTTVTGSSLSVAGGGQTFAVPTGGERYNVLYTPSAGGSATCTNAGNRATPAVIRIYGYCVNPQVLNVTTGERIVINGTVAAGDYLELDTYAHTVKVNGDTSRLQLLDSATTTWFDLARNATTTLRLLAGTFDTVARPDVLFRHAYS